MTEASNPSNRKRWYVLHVANGFEAKAKRALQELANNQGLQEAFGEILIPSESVIEVRAGKKCCSRKRVFPGYLIVHMILTDETWQLIRQTPHISGFVGRPGQPVPIGDDEADRILNRSKESEEKPRHRFHFEPGEEVRVKEGPFADFKGTVERVDFSKDRLYVLISIFGRATPIELGFQQVSKE